MKLIDKSIVLILVLLFLWMISVTSSPIKLRRTEKYYACDVNNISSWENSGGDLVINSFKSLTETSKSHIEFTYQHPPHQPGFECKFPIPEIILYRAITLNVTYKLNQPAYFDVGMRRVGQGPGWKAVKVDNDSANKIITSTWLLNEPEQLKLNWLSGSYEGVTFGVSKFDPNKDLILTIYQVYFE